MDRPACRLILALVTIVAVLAAGCSSAATAPAVQKVGASEAVRMLGSRVVVDVRTPAEFAAGHIAGAQNIDVDASDFGTRIARLDPKAAYLVYCRTGRRSGIAAGQMAAAGFTDIVDGGGMDALVAAGAPTE